ncbi:MAG: MBL fold metallo-hydrolase [Nitrospiraceae bacterium]|nr:MBL fold metallo-hydrolase [Nitrospiraceae bacterium]
MSILAISLQSGSNGNCIYVEAGGVKLLFDAGIPGIHAERRLAAKGRDIRQVDALIISHDHGDHVRHAGVFHRKYGMPVYATPATLESAVSRFPIGKLETTKNFRSGGNPLRFGGVTVQTIPTSHDGADGSAFIIECGGKRLGIMTDLGHPFEGLAHAISTLDAVFLESNYDPRMLQTGPYPHFLKKRIAGNGGHLSNMEAASLLAKSGKRLKWACLAHLSEQNNNPGLAVQTHRGIIGTGLTLYVASRYFATGILRV